LIKCHDGPQNVTYEAYAALKRSRVLVWIPFWDKGGVQKECKLLWGKIEFFLLNQGMCVR